MVIPEVGYALALKLKGSSREHSLRFLLILKVVILPAPQFVFAGTSRGYVNNSNIVDFLIHF